MDSYYITSTACTISARQSKKKGTVYDVVFRIIEKDTALEKLKKLSGFTSKRAAKEAYTKFVTEHCELLSEPFRLAKSDPVTDTVAAVYPKYIASIVNQSKDSTVCDRQEKFRRFILPEFGEVRIRDITVEKLYDWQDKLWATKNTRTGTYLSYNYLKSIRNTFSSFLGWYGVRNVCQNPFAFVKMPKRRVPKTEMSIWTEEEFRLFLEAVDDPMYKALFAAMFYTGRRRGEILALSPADVGSERIRFNKTVSTRTLDGSHHAITSTKNERSAYTIICPSLKEVLDGYMPDKQGQFFFGGSRPVPIETLRRKFHGCSTAAGLKQIRLHDLRHSFVSMVISKGATIPVVADMIGDTQEQVTKTYSHLYEADKERILAGI